MVENESKEKLFNKFMKKITKLFKFLNSQKKTTKLIYKNFRKIEYL